MRFCLCGTRAYAATPPATKPTSVRVRNDPVDLEVEAAFRRAGENRRRLDRILGEIWRLDNDTKGGKTDFVPRYLRRNLAPSTTCSAFSSWFLCSSVKLSPSSL